MPLRACAFTTPRSSKSAYANQREKKGPSAQRGTSGVRPPTTAKSRSAARCAPAWPKKYQSAYAADTAPPSGQKHQGVMWIAGGWPAASAAAAAS